MTQVSTRHSPRQFPLRPYNAEEFPLSGNVWDSLAEAYLTSGNKVLAEIYYRKALELDPQNANALEKLAKLREGSLQ